MKIGVLALQGAVREHIRHIELSGHEGIAVKKVEQLARNRGLNITWWRVYNVTSINEFIWI